MTIDILNKEGKKVETIELPSDVFGVRWNEEAIHQTILAAQGNARKTIANTKGRGDVSGGGKKPWKQKGTGRARHGSSRSPIWKGGGVTFGPTNERIFEKKVNKKMKRFALASLISRKLKDKKVFVFDSLEFTPAKTKSVSEFLRLRMGAKPSVLFIREDKNAILTRIARNIPKVEITSAASLDALKCAGREKIVFEKNALVAFITRMQKENQ